MSKLKLLALALFAASVVESNATVTLQFSTGSEKLTNIQNAAGDANNGLRWGIVVSTTNSTFDANGLNYDGFVFPASGEMVTLANGQTGIATDDVFYWGGNLTSTLGGTDGGANGISTLNNLPLTGGISAGDPFALIWFDSSSSADGAKYGFLTDASFVIPSDGSTTPFSSIFAGVDPVRLASNTLGTTVIPEPSRMFLAGIGLLGLTFRRRRV